MRRRALSNALEGHHRRESRLGTLDVRAGTYESYATATAALLAIGAAILTGREPVELGGLLAWIFVALLAAAVSCLIVSGFRGWQAACKPIDVIAPHRAHLVIRRAKQQRVAALDPDVLTALLVAEHRAVLVEDWKLERLKQASRFFALALIAVLVAAMLLVATQ